MTSIILDCETTGLAPVIKTTNQNKEIVREHKRILCISICNLANQEVKTFCGQDEKQFLKDFFSYLEMFDVNQLIGFNLEFDLNFIRARSFFNDVRMSESFLLSEKLDLRRVISSDQYSVGTLRTWAEVCGAVPVTENGEKMIENYEKGNWDFIRNHCIEDVGLTEIVFNRCKECGLIK